MRFYLRIHRFYCGVDLHARTMHVCIIDHDGNVVVDRNIAANPKEFLKLVAPYRAGIVVGVECMFAWYWLHDVCAAEALPFVLGHALYMRLIHGGKGKNDRIDADKIARLLRGGAFPLAYAYPTGMRETRDLLRRRMYLVRERGALVTHVRILNSQYNLPELDKEACLVGQWAEHKIAERFPHASVRQSVAVDVELIDHLDQVIDRLERYLRQTAQVDDEATYARLQTIPGVGKILGLVLMYELHAVARFALVGQFLSYARLVRCTHESAGKKVGTGGQKIGNAHLKWAFVEAACLMLRCSERARKWKQKYAAQHGQGKALHVLAAKLGRAVYHMLRKKEAFDDKRFWQSAAGGARPESAASATPHGAARGQRRRTVSSSLLPKERGHARH